MTNPGDVVFGRSKSGVEITGQSFISITKIGRAKIESMKKGLTTRAINAALTLAFTAGGNFWIRVFLIKRFDKGYAESALGYRAAPSYAEGKRAAAASGAPYRFTSSDGTMFSETKRVLPPQDRPYVLTGRSMNAALQGAQPVVVVRGDGTGSLKVTVPRGDITRNVIKNNQFAFVNGNEKQRVSQVVLQVFDSIVIPGILSGEIDKGFQKQHIPRVLQNAGQREAK